MYRIIYMQVHIEVELYSLFVLFSFTFCVALIILYPYLFIVIILKIIRYILSISTKYSTI